MSEMQQALDAARERMDQAAQLDCKGCVFIQEPHKRAECDALAHRRTWHGGVDAECDCAVQFAIDEVQA